MTDKEFITQLDAIELQIGQLLPLLPAIESLLLEARARRSAAPVGNKTLERRISNWLENVQHHVRKLVL